MLRALHLAGMLLPDAIQSGAVGPTLLATSTISALHAHIHAECIFLKLLMYCPADYALKYQHSILFYFFCGRDIHYKDAMKETTSVCEGHPQQKLQATRTT